MKEIEEYTGDGSVDQHGQPAIQNKTGQWFAGIIILGMQKMLCFLMQKAFTMKTYLTVRNATNVNHERYHLTCEPKVLIREHAHTSTLGRYCDNIHMKYYRLSYKVRSKVHMLSLFAFSTVQ